MRTSEKLSEVISRASREEWDYVPGDWSKEVATMEEDLSRFNAQLKEVQDVVTELWLAKLEARSGDTSIALAKLLKFANPEKIRDLIGELPA